jgi:hypothetical protein
VCIWIPGLRPAGDSDGFESGMPQDVIDFHRVAGRVRFVAAFSRITDRKMRRSLARLAEHNETPSSDPRQPTGFAKAQSIPPTSLATRAARE